MATSVKSRNANTEPNPILGKGRAKDRQKNSNPVRSQMLHPFLTETTQVGPVGSNTGMPSLFSASGN